MTKLTWRLSKLPTIQELLDLVKDKVITQEEAKEVLFNKTDELVGSQDVGLKEENESLKSEIKFLRELVNKLSNRNQIITTIKEIEKPYQPWPWYDPYIKWCNTDSSSQTLCGSINSIQTF